MARVAVGVSRERLAVDLGISSSMLARLELSGQLPNAADLALIARHLGLSLDELFADGSAAQPQEATA